MPCAYSADLRQKVITAIDNEMRPSEASRVFQLSRNTINLWRRQFEAKGTLVPEPPRHPPRSRAKIKDSEFMAFVDSHRDWSLKQFAVQFGVGSQTISKYLKRLGYTRKKNYGYAERDEERRHEFRWQLTRDRPRDVIYLDVIGMDERDRYDYGWSPRGTTMVELKPGSRRGRISAIGAYGVKERLFAPMTFEGSCNRNVVEKWLEEVLLPQLSPGKVLVLDNASFHKGGRIRDLVEEAGCALLYLPPYSPDLSPIEQCWGWIKARVRRGRERFEMLHGALDHELAKASHISGE